MIRRILALVVLIWTLGFVVFMLTLGSPAGADKTDAIVVPTGGPGRVMRGLDLMKAGAAQRMLITGVAPDVRPVELAAEHDTDPALFAKIDLGREAVDTRSNGEETAAWIAQNKFRTVRVVTSDWHMARALLEVRRAVGDDVSVIGDGVPSEPGLTMLVREYNKYLLRRAALWLGLGS